MKTLTDFLSEAENQGRKLRYDKIAQAIDKIVSTNKKLDSRTVRDLQRLNDMCVLASHHIDDANEYMTQARNFPKDKAAQQEAVDIKNEADKISNLADKKIQRLTPILLSKNIHIPA